MGELPTWTIALNVLAASLPEGKYYTICTDLDSSATNLAFGNTNEYVYISAVDSVSAHPIHPSKDQKISIECAKGCSQATTAYLSTSCDSTTSGTIHADGQNNLASASLVGSAPMFTLTV